MLQSIFTSTDSTISISSSVIGLFTALVLGIVIAITYMFISRKRGYNVDFIIGMAILPAIVSVVILLIGSNVARAFSMAGAFALVRFRSAPGSAKDIAVVFFSMASGLACGLGYISYAVLVTIILMGALILLSLIGFGGNKTTTKQLKITIPEDLNYESLFEDLFERYTKRAELRFVKTTNMGTLFELTYLIEIKNDIGEKEFIDDIRCRNGNLNISIGMIPDQTSITLN